MKDRDQSPPGEETEEIVAERVEVTFNGPSDHSAAEQADESSEA